MVELVRCIVINGRWQNNHDKGNRKGKANGFEASNALNMLGMIVLNIVHVVHG